MTQDHTNRTLSVTARNASLLPSMPRALRRIGEVLIQDPALVMRMTVEELAAKADCSEGSVIRWCKELGFSGFQDLKLTLAVDTAYQTLHTESPTTPQSDTFTSLNAALAETERYLNPEAITQAAQRLCHAQRILIVGVGGSAHVAHYLQYRLIRLGSFSEVHIDMHMALMAVSVLPKEAVVVAVSSSGSTIDISDIVTLAQARHATTIALTNRPHSRLTKNATITLLAGHSGDVPLAGGSAESVVTQIAVIECLTEAMLTLEPGRKQALVSTAESVLSRIY